MPPDETRQSLPDRSAPRDEDDFTHYFKATQRLSAENARLRAENEALKAERKQLAADVSQRLDWIVRDRREPDKVLVNTSTVRSVLIRYLASDEQRPTEACPYCDGSGQGDLVPGAHAYARCETCGGTGRLDVADAHRLRENRAGASPRLQPTNEEDR